MAKDAHMNRIGTIGAIALTLAAAASAGIASNIGPRRSASAGVQGTVGQRRWQLALDVALTQSVDQAPARIHVTGQWRATPCAWRAGEYDVAHELADVHVEGEAFGTPSAGDVEALEKRLARRFLVTYRDDGAAVRVHFPKDVAPTDRNLLEMIVTETQFVHEKTEAKQWSVLERDGAGTYFALYQGTPGSTTKRKIKYVDVDGAPGSASATIRLEQSTIHFATDPAGHLLSLDGREKLNVGVPFGVGGSLGIDTAITLYNATTAAAPELEENLAPSNMELDDEPIRTRGGDPRAMQRQQDAQLLAGQSAETLVRAAGIPSTDRLLPARLAALFRRDPRAIGAALALVRSATKTKTILASLASAQTGEAIDALGRLAHDNSAPSRVRAEALTATMVIQHPSAKAMRLGIDLLADSDRDVRISAQLASGALARLGRSEHSDEATAIDAALLATWEHTTDDREKLNLLGAFGNSAGTKLLPELEKCLKAPSPEVRAVAAWALRLFEADGVDAMLATAITEDADPQVREAAIRAAGGRSFEPFKSAVLKAAATDATTHVRAEAVRYLKNHADESALVSSTLARVATGDPSSGVRQLAASATLQTR
jgi:hypothetical protein